MVSSSNEVVSEELGTKKVGVNNGTRAGEDAASPNFTAQAELP